MVHPVASNRATGRNWAVVAVVGTGNFTTAVLTSIINAILPLINREFQADLGSLSWIVMVYLLTISSLLLTLGRLGDMIGHKRLYQAGLLLFIASSLFSSLATSLEMLIAARFFQAFGGAAVHANSMAIAAANFPASRRGEALGFQTMATYIGLTTGPSLGGLLAENLGWRSVFWVHVPIGLITASLIWRIIPDDRRRQPEKFDLWGAGLYMAGLAACLLSLSRAEVWGWGSPQMLGLLGAGLLTLAIFAIHELRVPAPMLDLRLFRNRLFTAATASALLNYICLYSVFMLMPFYLILGRGFAPSFAGLLLAAQPIVMATTAPFSGRLSDRIGSRLPASAGMILLAVGIFLLGALGPDASEVDIVWRLALLGLGVGLFTTSNSNALFAAVGAHQRGIATGVVATARNTGMVVGYAVAAAVLSASLSAFGGNVMTSSPALFQALHVTFWVLALFAVVGAITSLVRGGAPVGAALSAAVETRGR